MPDELLTVAQTASYMQLSEKIIRRLIKNQCLTASKVGDRSWRIQKDDIHEYLKAHSNGKDEH